MMYILKRIIEEGKLEISFGMKKEDSRRVIKDKLHLEKVDSDNNYYYLSDRIYPLVVHLEEEEDKLTIYFSPSHYNRLFINLPALKDEVINGCDQVSFNENLKFKKCRALLDKYNILENDNTNLISKIKKEKNIIFPIYKSSMKYLVKIETKETTHLNFKRHKTEIICNEIPKCITVSRID